MDNYRKHAEPGNTSIEDALHIIMTPNHFDNPFLTHDGAGILPKQTRWIMLMNGTSEDRYSEIYDKLYARTLEEGYAYTHEDVPVWEEWHGMVEGSGPLPTEARHA